MPRFEVNQKVRLVTAPDRNGRIVSGPRIVAGRERYRVDFGDITQEVSADNLETSDETQATHTLISEGRFGGAANLKLAITHTRLTGRLADVIYSMESSNTEFFPYQFKPVLNFLESPSNGILIADEVGLGKTIEAGLVWTELRAREDANRLLVLCPAMLREKWQDELKLRFGVRADIVNAKDLLKTLRSRSLDDRSGFAVIASFNGLRPPSEWADEEETRKNPRAELARLLREHESDESLFDLVVIDEAHYLRNPSTQTNELGHLLRQVSESMLLLSATPIQMCSEDLFNLLQVIDEDNFQRRDDFEEILEANAPLVALASQLRTSELTRDQIYSSIADCRQHRLLANNARLNLIEERIRKIGDLREHSVREQIADQIERVNLLARVVNRTRKRDVQENRVVRDVVAPFIEMTETEREYYNQVTAIVRAYCLRRGLSEGFIQTIPQRQMCSSIPASFRAWSSYSGETLPVEIGFEDLGIDPEIETVDEEEDKPLIRELAAAVTGITNFEVLKEEDSKYTQLLETLRSYWKDYPTEKVILFSYYRESLKYLNERLREDGEQPVVLMGGMQDSKHEIIESFKNDGGCRILLSSEVASEGVDLQFASFLINYDLPWNPMRVEQRIGRIDRIGQKLPKIQIRNYFYAATLDARIYNRLFARLEIFESALGDAEAVLGEQVQSLANFLLTHDLSPEEEEAQIDQTAMALATNIRTQGELEDAASALAAHGDFVLNKVKAAHELRRFIDGESLWIYVYEFISQKYPGSKLTRTELDPLTAEISLSSQARAELRSFLEGNRDLAPTRLARATVSEKTKCVFSNQLSFGSAEYEIISQHHSLVRFISNKVNLERDLYPVTAIQVTEDAELALNPGHYILIAHMWSATGARTREKLVLGASAVNGQNKIEEEQAEILLRSCVERGTDWHAAENKLPLDQVGSTHDELEVALEDRFVEYATQMQAENDADVEYQLETLRRHVSNQISVIQEVIANHRALGRTRMIPANEGRIKRLREYAKQKEEEIEQKRKISIEPRTVVSAVVHVVSC